MDVSRGKSQCDAKIITFYFFDKSLPESIAVSRKFSAEVLLQLVNITFLLAVYSLN